MSSEPKVAVMYQYWTEAIRLLDLINMEWKTDPVSIQCFDLRIVEDTRKLLEEIGKNAL